MALRVIIERIIMDSHVLVAQARRYLGVRFAHQGRSKETGVDCLGLLLCAAEDSGLSVRQYDRRDYRAFPDTEMLRVQLDHALDRVDTIQTGDVILFNIEGRPQHLALVSDYPAENVHGVIHAYAPMRKVVEHRLDAMWQQRIEQVYRLPD